MEKFRWPRQEIILYLYNMFWFSNFMNNEWLLSWFEILYLCKVSICTLLHGGSNILLTSSTKIAKNFFKIPGYCLIFGNIIHHYIYVSSAVILRFNLKIVLLCILVFTLLFEYNYTRIHENKTYLPESDVFLVHLCEYITSTVSWSFFYVAKNRVKQIKV